MERLVFPNGSRGGEGHGRGVAGNQGLHAQIIGPKVNVVDPKMSTNF
jgi:hypothetical protein